jgi:nicotinate phosphoribosyltransferase
LGATGTQIVVTGDLDERSIGALSSAPVDGFGAGTSVVMGSGYPTSGFIYKLVEAGGRPVEKRSPGKATYGGRKWAWRVPGRAVDVVSTSPDPVPEGGRPLQSAVVRGGVVVAPADLGRARSRHERSRSELGPGRLLGLDRR